MYKLYFFKEEEREIELDLWRFFNVNRLRVYFKDIYSIWGWNRSVFFVEEVVLCEEIIGIGV